MRSLGNGEPVADREGVIRGTPLPAEKQLKYILEPEAAPADGAFGLQVSFSSGARDQALQRPDELARMRQNSLETLSQES